jgi:hypothetical protein
MGNVVCCMAGVHHHPHLHHCLSRVPVQCEAGIHHVLRHFVHVFKQCSRACCFNSVLRSSILLQMKFEQDTLLYARPKVGPEPVPYATIVGRGSTVTCQLVVSHIETCCCQVANYAGTSVRDICSTAILNYGNLVSQMNRLTEAGMQPQWSYAAQLRRSSL